MQYWFEPDGFCAGQFDTSMSRMGRAEIIFRVIQFRNGFTVSAWAGMAARFQIFSTRGNFQRHAQADVVGRRADEQLVVAGLDGVLLFGRVPAAELFRRNVHGELPPWLA